MPFESYPPHLQNFVYHLFMSHGIDTDALGATGEYYP